MNKKQLVLKVDCSLGLISLAILWYFSSAFPLLLQGIEWQSTPLTEMYSLIFSESRWENEI
jgi:hypothetical protein